jgi:uncharacterized membrane protein
MASVRRGRPLHIIRSFEAEELKKRSLAIKFADTVTQIAGSIQFFIINILFFAGWIIVNTGLIPGVKAFDTYPFVMLTTIVSLEAIMLAIFVLMSQNRQSIIASLREETQLQVNLIAEREITKTLKLLDKILDKHQIKVKDEELEEMLKEIDQTYIERELQKQLTPVNPNIPEELARVVTQPIEKVRESLQKKETPIK